MPPIVNEGTNLADNAPRYVQDVRDYVQKNERLNEINQDYQITDKLEEEAAKLPSRIGGAAGVLRDIGFGLVNGIFALVTILVLAAFMLSGGPDWRRRALGLMPPDRAERLDRILTHMARGSQRLRDRGAGDRRDRRDVDLHRADDHRSPVRGAACRDGGPVLAGAAGGRNDRRGADRHRDPLR